MFKHIILQAANSQEGNAIREKSEQNLFNVKIHPYRAGNSILSFSVVLELENFQWQTKTKCDRENGKLGGHEWLSLNGTEFISKPQYIWNN